ncbi:MAG: HAMP domain-containing histidine kinase [Saccharospirillaceae bacterium]|nr:HAMP domain-containing histidine kinase [Pseudomonadales bacterium]NRB79426.1 HAMP domain-containing histidine kinase [Saccharospirillaceae bacterium]
MKNSLVYKLLIISLVSIFIIYSIANFYSYLKINKLFTQLEQEQILILENRLTKVVPISLWYYDYDQIQEAIDSEIKSSLVSYIEVRDLDNTEIAKTTPTTADGLYNIQLPLFYKDKTDKKLGHVLIKIDTSSKNKLINELIEGFIVQLLITMLLISLLLYAYSRKFIVLPLEKLELSMKQIADDTADLTQRLEFSKNNTEISRVSSTFNRIIAKIENLMIASEKKNNELSAAIEELNRMQSMLIESEKMASLGSLVAGVAHEINTPVGIGITATSMLIDETTKIKASMENKTLSSSSLIDAFKNIEKAAELTLNHLFRVSSLISNFKQVAVDQSIDNEREICLKQYVDEIHSSLLPRFKTSAVKFTTDINENIFLKINAGQLAQVLTNLIINAYIHAFDEYEIDNREISIQASQNEINTIINIKDNGKGMDQKAVKTVFEPFYTTKRNKGGTGLGTHIVFNIVHHKFGGIVICESVVAVGTNFIITIPRVSNSSPTQNVVFS